MMWKNIVNTASFLLLISGFIVIAIWKKGSITEDQTLLFLSLLVGVIAIVNLIYSVAIGKAVAKGIVIEKSKSPALYFVIVLVYCAIIIVCGYGLLTYSSAFPV